MDSNNGLGNDMDRDICIFCVIVSLMVMMNIWNLNLN